MTRQTRFNGLTAAVLLVCSAFLPGCGPGRQQAENFTVAAVPAALVEGQVKVWSWNTAAKSLQALTPAFEKQDPHVRVSVDMTGARMQTRLMLSLIAGVGAPDVSQLFSTDAPHYIATGRLTDLTSVAAKYRSQFPPALWADCTLHGRVYAIPWDIGPCAVYYKRSLFRKYGIDPAKIETWADYIAAGQQIVQRSGGRTKMLALGPNDLQALFEILIQQTGGQVFDGQGHIAVDSPQTRQALAVIRQMRQAGICSDVPAYSQEWMAGFSGDSLATYPSAVWLAGTIKDTAGDYAGRQGDWGVFRLPAVVPGGLRVANSGGSVLVIPSESQNKAAAWAFIEYALCTRAGQSAQYQNFDLFPAFLPALTAPAFDQPDPFFGGQRVARLFATDVSKIPPLNRTASWAEASGYLSQDLSHWAATGMPEGDILAPLAQKLSSRLDVPVAAGGG
ncbi:MAG: ABC transporter substrate-binding protein [Janthinobacterium lividum]